MSLTRDKTARPDDADERHLPPTLPIRIGENKARREPLHEEATDPVPVIPPLSLATASRITPHRLSNQSIPASQYRRGQIIGDYEIIEELARGGMGVVFKANQRTLNRPVALKVVLRGDFARLEDLLRFQIEAQAVARLQHPHLVSIFEIGEHEGLPYYSMELMAGGTLAKRITGHQMDARAAAKFMLPLVDAIDYAHSRGIIHRDLKPANILLSDADESLEKCSAKITDFGVAKHLGLNTQLTRTGEILGTPSYMAPEQATGHTADVGPAADVYSLGTILYELLTGKSPFIGSDPADTILRVLHSDAEPPRKLNPKVPADLETICLKCLEKKPSRRYASAALFAEDLRRFLADEPIMARPATLVERSRKWIKRSPAKATMAAAGFLLAIGAVAAMVTFWFQAIDKAKVEAALLKTKEQNLAEVRLLLADALLERGIAMAEKRDVRRGLHWMVRSLDLAESLRDRDPEIAGAADLAEACRYNLAHWSQHAATPDRKLPHGGWAWAMAFSPDSRFAFTGSADKCVRVWDSATGEIIGDPFKHAGPVWTVVAHPKGEFLFAAGGENQGELRTYEMDRANPGRFAPKGQILRAPVGFKKLVPSPAGDVLVGLLYSGAVRLYRFDAEQDEPLALRAQLIPGGAVAAEFDAEGKTLYVIGGKEVLAIDVAGRKLASPPWQPGGMVTAMALTPDRKILAVATLEADNKEAAIHLWDLQTDEKRLQIVQHKGEAKTMAVSPDGRVLAVGLIVRDKGHLTGDVQFSGIEGNGLIASYPPIKHPGPVWSLAFHPSSPILVTGCEDGHSRIWDLVTNRLIAPPSSHEGTVANLAISPDGRHLLTASAGGAIHAHARLQELPRLAAAPRILGLPEPIVGLAWDSDGETVHIKDHRKIYSTWNLRARKQLREIPVEQPDRDVWIMAPGHIGSFNFKTKQAMIQDLATGEKTFFPDFPLAWPTFGQVSSGVVPVFDENNNKLILYKVPGGQRHGAVVDVTGRPNAFFAHDASKTFGVILPIHTKVGPDQQITVGSDVRIWDIDGNLRQQWTFKDPCNYAVMNPTGTLLATCNANQVQFFNVATGAPYGRPISHDGRFHQWAFHPTENLLAFGNAEGDILTWHIPTSKAVGKAVNLGGLPRWLGFRPDGAGTIASAIDRAPVTWQHLGPKTGDPQTLKRWVEALTGTALDPSDELVPLGSEQLAAVRREFGL